MPFVDDILGPRRPFVDGGPQSLPGVRRRTSTIDTHPDGVRGSVADLRARDVVGAEDGRVEILGEVGVRAHLTDQVVDDITAPAGLDALLGCRVGAGFRATVGRLFPEEVVRASLLNLLLDDWVGAALVSGYAAQYAAIVEGVEEKMPLGIADRMAGICAGFAPDASLIAFTRRHDVIPTGRGPVAPPLSGLHEVEPLRARGMRRYRRLDLADSDSGSARFHSHFRDSHVDDDLVETIVHEYTVAGTIDTSTRVITGVNAEVRVLPWQECPGAIGSASRIRGMTLAELRDRVRGEFVGTSTCTHLNDTLRSIADLQALMDSR
ncbi:MULTISPECIES: DUF2889 domain-containing protein [unclassified Mycobacterium]|uniref:DUF2889 domain-containing protein n=1 Tax=unclassified Mycobacterium TaxID=2642494 RepID=UPI0007FC7FA7|nr:MULTISPECIES: DUF2889 domain-containing protein [unclassified Mycobacterium]OBG65081.1 hypothetical protein A5703_01075 [Mycobacterium sp. E188]OBH47066.1 hypothetical protein A5691_00005 [Mycobacterium sp. E183]